MLEKPRMTMIKKATLGALLAGALSATSWPVNADDQEIKTGGCWTGCNPNPKGRMVGEGSVFTKKGNHVLYVKHQFKLHCDKHKKPNSLEVKWTEKWKHHWKDDWKEHWKDDDKDDEKKHKKEYRFYLKHLEHAICYDDKKIKPNPAPAGFDSHDGRGEGWLNGVYGAKADWVLTDAGKHGKKDTIKITIKDKKGKTVLDLYGRLDSGDHQAYAH